MTIVATTQASQTPSHLLQHVPQRVQSTYAERNQSELLNWVNGHETITITVESRPEYDDGDIYFYNFTYTIKATYKSFSFTDYEIDYLKNVLDKLTEDDGLFDMFLFPNEAMPYIHAIQAGISPSNIHETEEAIKSKQALTSHLNRIFQLIADSFVGGGATMISLTRS